MLKEQLQKTLSKIGKRGQIGPLGLVIPLVLVFGLAVVIAVVMSTVAGSTFASVQTQLAIDGNTLDNPSGERIEADINAAVESSFEAYNQATSQLDLLAIIAVAFVVISAVVMFMRFGQPAGGGML